MADYPFLRADDHAPGKPWLAPAASSMAARSPMQAFGGAAPFDEPVNTPFARLRLRSDSLGSGPVVGLVGGAIQTCPKSAKLALHVAAAGGGRQDF